MNKSRCLLDYHRYGTSRLEVFSNGVANGIYSNPSVFSAPIIAQPAFSLLQTAYNSAVADYDIYGATKKTALTHAQTALIDGLNLHADYVNSIANGDESIIILSGFVPSSTVPQSNIPLEAIGSFSVKRTSVVGEIAVEIPAIANHGTINYVCVCAEANPLSNPVFANGQIQTVSNDVKIRIDINKNRKKLFTGLTPGTVYYFYVTAINTVSVAPISDVKSLMAA